MQVHVKMPHIKIDIKGEISKRHLSLLKKEYGKNVRLINTEEDEVVDVFKTDWYKNIKSQMTPGNNLKVYRMNRGLTQEHLGEILGGIPKQHISNMENGKRPISLKMAKNLSKIFKVSVEKFI
jgi:DNA-binding XRE family transcriptional regulator